MKVWSSVTTYSSSSSPVTTLLLLLLSIIGLSLAAYSEEENGAQHGHSILRSGLNRDLQQQSSTSDSDLIAFWYKPHNECGMVEGSTPDGAVDFINEQFTDGVDFMGIAAWLAPSTQYPIASTEDNYGIISGVCGFNQTNIDGTTPQVLFYNNQKWNLDKSYPSNPSCNFVPTSPFESDDPIIGDVCNTRTVPGDDTCCTCVFSEEEYYWGQQMDLGLGQRPWVAGLFTHKDDATKQVCVVTAQFPHPLQNTTLSNLNGQLLVASTDQQQPPYTLQKYLCTNTGTNDDCVPNLSNTSPIEFGSDNIGQITTTFCGSTTPTIFMADTNVGPGYVDTGLLFTTEPLSSLMDYKESENPYTCCNDTIANRGLNTFSTDRLAISSSNLKYDLLEGGSIAPRGPVTDPSMGYKCHSKEEHLPLRAHISFLQSSGATDGANDDGGNSSGGDSTTTTTTKPDDNNNMMSVVPTPAPTTSSGSTALFATTTAATIVAVVGGGIAIWA